MRRTQLYNAQAATSATLVTFRITERDFENGGTPAIKSYGLGASDTITIWERVAGDWQSAYTLTDTDTSVAIESVGDYAVTITLTTSSDVNCELNSSSDVD